jgi:hypothetical protein
LNIFQHWIFYQKPDLDFLNISYTAQFRLEELRSLDERRKKIQKEILSLSSASEICRTCPVSCCRGNYNHFTVVDYVIRIASDKPIHEFAESTPKPPSLFELLAVKLKFYKPPTIFPAAGHDRHCSYLTPSGCALSVEDRPIRCVIYTCQAYRNSFPEPVVKRMGILTQELLSISRQALSLFSG